MWKGLFLLVCVLSIDVVISGDEPAVTTAAPTTEPPVKPTCGCGGYPPKCLKNEVYNNCSLPVCRLYRCSDLGSPCNTKCTPGCICRDGYLRDGNGVCIPIKNCPKPPPECGKNEVYNNCSHPVCRPYNCSNLGFECNFKCEIGCICKTGYLRDDNGVCIPIKCCLRCFGDLNAEPGDGNNCGKTCATYKLKPAPVCKIGSRFNDCVCKDGYVYDPNVKACVRPKYCTPTCKDNEVYSTCINCEYGPQNCSEIDEPNICVDPDTVTCKKGCVCIKGYLRAPDGTCVPKDKCPPKCPKGEVWEQCPLGLPCEADNCPKTKDSPQTCPIGDKCYKPRCICEYNRKIDPKTGKCILITDCPPFKCGHNEEYQACSPNCPGENCSDINKTKCPLNKGVLICRPACKCIKGTYRNPFGKCVPACDLVPPPASSEYSYSNLTRLSEKTSKVTMRVPDARRSWDQCFRS